MRVAVLGLGEAGSRLAADLARAGDEVYGYDPASVPPIAGVVSCESPEAALAGSTLALAIIPASRASALLDRIVELLDDGLVYADLSTGSPGLKEDLAKHVAKRGAFFVDVALMAPVPERGLATPALASGSGAVHYAAWLNARGGRVEVVGEQAGSAAARKLLRSVVMKGLAALLIEGTEAASRYGQGEWFWGHLVDQLAAVDEELMKRLLHGTPIHARRRLDEMEAARDLLVELGVPPTMTTATLALLHRLTAEETLPSTPATDSVLE